MNPAAVDLVDVRKSYGAAVALDGLTLSVPEGSITGLLGPNGAGKTTTLEMCAGLHRADSGTVRVLGRDPYRAGPQDRAEVGVMLQRGGVWSSATAAQAVRHIARFHAAPMPVDDLIARLHLDRLGRTPFRRMSGGEQQRVKLGCAIVGRPRLAILDEPSSGMDPGTRRDIWELIEQMRNDGTTVVLSTHSLEEAERLSDRITIVADGRCVASGTTAELTARPGGPELRFRASSGLDRDALLAALPAGFDLAEDLPGRYRLTGADVSPATIAAVTAWCADRGVLAAELTLAQRDLEQVFLDLTARQPEVAS